jgi:hypothetical protein
VTAVSAPDAADTLARLRRLLDDDDAEAQDLAAAEQPAIRAAVGDRLFDPLMQAIEAFDFEKAREICTQAAQDQSAEGTV